MDDLGQLIVPAASGLLGVAVGGIIQRWATLSAEDKRAEHASAAEQREQDRADQRELLVTKSAARLVLAELKSDLSTVEVYKTLKQWTDYPLEFGAWEDNRGVLARLLTNESDWETIDTAYAGLRTLETTRRRAWKNDEPVYEPQYTQALDLAIESLHSAATVLTAVVGGIKVGP